MNIDMWYGDKPEDADRIDVFWNDIGCYHSGNIYKNGTMIGDYTCKDISELIEKHFPHLEFRENAQE